MVQNSNVHVHVCTVFLRLLFHRLIMGTMVVTCKLQLDVLMNESFFRIYPAHMPACLFSF